MSDKKPGFFKRLLGSLMGSSEETPPEREETPEVPEPRAEKPKAAARKKAPAKAKASTKPKAAPKEKPASKAKEKPAPKTAKKPAAKSEPEPAAKPKTEKPKAEKKAPPKAAAKPSRKPPARKAAAKETPAPKTAKPAKPSEPEAVEAPPEPEAAPEAPQEEKKRRSLTDMIFGGKEPEAGPAPESAPGPEAAADPEPAPAAEPVAEAEPSYEPVPEPAAGAEPEPPAKKGWFSRLRDGLSKTSNALTENITTIFTKRKLDDETLQELEDALIQADLGVDMAVRITEEVARGRYNKEIAPEEVRAVLGAEVAGVLEPMAVPLTLDASKTPHVILVVGVNGTGKTTTIGKLANQFAMQKKKVVLAAGDTFRAAAIEQLQIWGERTGAPVVARHVGADAAGLAFDALQKARDDKADVLLIDTAGRLQNKKDLMDELAKIVRVIKKLDESAPHSVLLVLDATTGQNAISQVEVFQEIAGVTGLIMTKLDGTARGGILVAIANRFAIPVHAIGVGESVEDLQPFDAYEFASIIAGAREKVEADA